MTKPSKKLSNQRSSMDKARKSRHTRQKSPSPWPSPTPHSNYSISAPSTPPASAISTPASHRTSEISLGNLEILDQWPNDEEHSYLHEHCNYTHAGFQENLPQALASVDISTIWKWEHRMIRWMEAYRGGKNAKEASLLVKQFSSHRYDSHC